MKLVHRNLSKIAVKRLGALCSFFEKMTREETKHFDMGHWFLDTSHDKSAESKKIFNKLMSKVKIDGFSGDGELVSSPSLLHVCTTRACALGWAASMPEFKKLGLEMAVDVIVNDNQKEIGDSVYFRVNGNRLDALRAAARFFDISGVMARELFGGNGPNGASTPKEWAREVRYAIQTDGLGFSSI